MSAYTKLETGIGRPVGEAWFHELQDLLSDEASGLIWFTPRTSPGLQYVAAKELSQIHGEEYRGEETEKRVAGQARVLIEALETSGELNPTQSRVSINLERPKGLGLDEERGRLRVVARVLDIPSDLYPEGYLCAGERAAVRRALKLPVEGSTPRMRSVPLKNISFGSIEGDRSQINFLLTSCVNSRLTPGIVLQKVDTTRL